ncbi:MAG: TM2 domain-containing protein [Clostridia bacterium]|nr:TM2 domain-containing protein [Clostridia bacterium]
MDTNQNPVNLQEENLEPISPKSKITTGLLALFLGCIGVDQFYLGKVGAGIGSICITLACILAGMAFSGIIGIIGIVTGGIALILAPLAGFCGIPAGIWPLIRAIKAFMGKAKDKSGARIVN